MSNARVWLCAGLLALSASPARATSQEVVVLLHGLYRSDRSMRPLEEAVAEAGFQVVNFDYASRSQSAESLVAELDREIAACCSTATKLHFVTHSLGGIVTRAWLAQHRPANLGRVVMLAPPNHGSPLADVVAGSALLRFFAGGTAALLGTDPLSLPNRLPPADFELGVIAGTASRNPLGAIFIDGESDGTVSVASTRLDGMTDFTTVDSSHTFIMRSDEAMAETVHFLRSGAFQHTGE
ncbi:MAG: esterase/lipase family protein [Myxococcota bacterium]